MSHSRPPNAVSIPKSLCDCASLCPREICVELSELSDASLKFLAHETNHAFIDKTSFIRNLTGRDISQLEGDDCVRCKRLKVAIVEDDSELASMKSLRKEELTKFTIPKLKGICDYLGVKAKGNKVDIINTIVDCEIAGVDDVSARQKKISSLFQQCAPGDGVCSNMYRAHFSKVDKFNTLFYRIRPSPTQIHELLRIYLDVLSIVCVNAYSLFCVENHRIKKEDKKYLLEEVIGQIIEGFLAQSL